MNTITKTRESLFLPPNFPQIDVELANKLWNAIPEITDIDYDDNKLILVLNGRGTDNYKKIIKKLFMEIKHKVPQIDIQHYGEFDEDDNIIFISYKCI